MTGAGRPSRVDLEIERLVLGEPGISPAGAERLRVLVEADVARLLARSALDLASHAAPNVVAPPVRLPGRPADHDLATRLARAIVHSIRGV